VLPRTHARAEVWDAAEERVCEGEKSEASACAQAREEGCCSGSSMRLWQRQPKRRAAARQQTQQPTRQRLREWAYQVGTCVAHRDPTTTHHYTATTNQLQLVKGGTRHTSVTCQLRLGRRFQIDSFSHSIRSASRAGPPKRPKRRHVRQAGTRKSRGASGWTE
jgi:hypothetical protein